jgi:hypothetical protein
VVSALCDQRVQQAATVVAVVEAMAGQCSQLQTVLPGKHLAA